MEGLQISQHAKERYAERIMNKTDKTEIAAYVNTHEEKIQTDISKMIEFGSKIYEGNTSNQTKTSYVVVYLNGTWVVLVDPKQNKVITLYTVDLMVGKEFNDTYMTLIKDKIESLKNDISSTVNKLEGNNKDLKESIDEEENEYKNLKKELNRIQERMEVEKQMIESNNAAILAEKEKMKTFINGFLKRKVL